MKDMENTELAASIIGAFVATLLASFFSLKILEIEHLTVILAARNEELRKKTDGIKYNMAKAQSIIYNLSLK